MKLKGFRHKGFTGQMRRIYFMDGRGKDISFARWRMSLYYAPNYAETHFEPSEDAYNAFLKLHKADCYEDFKEFRKDWRKLATDNPPFRSYESS